MFHPVSGSADDSSLVVYILIFGKNVRNNNNPIIIMSEVSTTALT